MKLSITIEKILHPRETTLSDKPGNKVFEYDRSNREVGDIYFGTFDMHNVLWRSGLLQPMDFVGLWANPINLEVVNHRITGFVTDKNFAGLCDFEIHRINHIGTNEWWNQFKPGLGNFAPCWVLDFIYSKINTGVGVLGGLNDTDRFSTETA